MPCPAHTATRHGDTATNRLPDPRVRAQVLRRIGWLNMWNPLDPDVMYRSLLPGRAARACSRRIALLLPMTEYDAWGMAREESGGGGGDVLYHVFTLFALEGREAEAGLTAFFLLSRCLASLLILGWSH
jgi:hypothetical protein